MISGKRVWAMASGRDKGRRKLLASWAEDTGELGTG